MSKSNRKRLFRFAISLAVGCPWILQGPSTSLYAQEVQRSGPFVVQRDAQSGNLLHTMEMTIHPKAEPRPALKYQFFPDPFESVDGNSAIYYLKAQGFLEQTGSRNLLNEMTQKAVKEASEKGVDMYQLPPFVWQDMAPKDLPVEEVKKYLALTRFQTYFLAEAARRRTYSADRNMRDQENPIGYLLPEIQSMRELARTQSVRCRVAIAEGRIQDAFEIIGQQFAMANHLGADDFIVSNLVGVACAGIAWQDALYFVEHADAPNLYWAIASLPHPLVDIEGSMAFERQLLYQQVKLLREVNETPKPAAYWQDFIDKVLPAFQSLEMIGPARTSDPELTRAAFVAAIGASYPGAKRFLLEELQMDRAKVEAYPTAQVVFLALCRFYDRARDDQFKWYKIPIERAMANPGYRKMDEQLRQSSSRLGWASAPPNLLLPALSQIKAAQQRLQQSLALLQTVEAIRMYGTDHQGKLPVTLDELPVPAPLDPFTGKPIAYEVDRDRAILTGHRLVGLQYRFILRFDNVSK